VEEVWQSAGDALGLLGATAGRHVCTRGEAPALEGTVERLVTTPHPSALIVLDSPAPGAALVNVYRWGQPTMLSLTLYLFGPDAHGVAAREDPGWTAWSERLVHMAVR
jgi:hypothetical protein